MEPIKLSRIEWNAIQFGIMCDYTFHVLKTIGIPKRVKSNRSFCQISECLHVAMLNKIDLFYLGTLKRFGDADAWKVKLWKLREQQNNIPDLAWFQAGLSKRMVNL